MLTWGDYRTQLRRSVLKDTDLITWDDDVARDLLWWALDTFCAHTAVATGVTYEAPVTGAEIAVPSNMYSPLETTGLLYLRSTDIILIEPDRSIGTSLTTPRYTYSTWGDYLTISDTPDVAYELVIRYFAYYNHPVTDNDPIPCPQWAIPAMNYLIGALALTSIGMQSANINQWKVKNDSGNPEDNALRIQQQHMMQQYEDLLRRYPRQDRENYYRRLLKT